MEASKSKEYEQGWNDAFDVIADYVEKEVCMITGSMIRRMRYEEWRYNKTKNEVEEFDPRPDMRGPRRFQKTQPGLRSRRARLPDPGLNLEAKVIGDRGMNQIPKFLRREQAANYLFERYGFGARSSLAKWACDGSGPKFRLLGRYPVYMPDDLDAWAMSRLSSLQRSTSDKADPSAA